MREQATKWLEDAKAADWVSLLNEVSDHLILLQSGFMVALAGELANPGQSAEGRQQAGLQLKQCLKSKDADVSAQYEANWLALDEGTRSTIKGSVCFT